MFTINGEIYGDLKQDEYGELGMKNENHYRQVHIKFRTDIPSLVQGYKVA